MDYHKSLPSRIRIVVSCSAQQFPWYWNGFNKSIDFNCSEQTNRTNEYTASHEARAHGRPLQVTTTRGPITNNSLPAPGFGFQAIIRNIQRKLETRIIYMCDINWPAMIKDNLILYEILTKNILEECKSWIL